MILVAKIDKESQMKTQTKNITGKAKSLKNKRFKFSTLKIITGYTFLPD